MEEIKSPKAEKPLWLVSLEEESWQAELIISGAAIFGCFLLPDALIDLETYILNTINREGLLLWYIIMMFANMLAYTLIFTFVLHFSLRALWIGIVGFNSVYPEGYQPNKAYSEDYQQKVMADFSDTNGYISRLDRLCSSIFGGGFSIALMALGYLLLMAVFGVIFYLIRSHVNVNFSIIVLYALFGLFVSYIILNTVMSQKSMRDKAWVKRWHYPMNKYFTKIVMNIGYRPASYVFNVIGSRAGNTKYGIAIFVLLSMVAGLFGASFGLSNMRVSAYVDRAYHRYSEDTTALYAEHYADTRPEGTHYRPTITDYEIYPNDLLTVFLPLPNREAFVLEEQCDLPPINEDDLSRSEARQANKQRTLDCAHQYYKFYLNGQQILDYSLKRHWFGTDKQYGFLATFYGANFVGGENLMRIESNYLNHEEKVRTANIPFYFFPEKSRPKDD